ncbi:MAG: tyrosine-type recombinase/integrase [Solirubrobacteraceae bacterium]
MAEQSASIRLSAEHKGRKRREPVWIGRYRIVGKDSARVLGKAWTKRSRAPDGYLTRSQAEEALRRLLTGEAATVKASEGMTFGQVADAYLTSLEVRIRSGSFRASTLRTYSNIIEKELRPRWGELPIASVTREDIGEYRAELAARNLAATTLNQSRAIVRGIFVLAVERFGLEDDPSVAFKRAKTRRATSGKIGFYPPDEVMRLVEHAESEQDAAVLLTAAFTGLRASELRALRWRSVDWAGSLTHVERGFTDEGGEDLPKSYRVRSVPLMPQVALALTKLRTREFSTDDDDLVFCNQVGKVLDYDALARRYHAAQKRAGLRPLRFHDLRHSFGTMAVRQFPITDVQTWMGHADIATTRKYIHYAPQPEAAARLGALVGEQLAQVTQLREAG